MKCVGCSVPLIPDTQWRRLSPAEREAATFRCHRGRQLCSTCYQRAIRADALLDHEGINADADSVLEDAIILVDERGYIYRNLPAALGIEREAFTRMVARADERGDERAHRLRVLNPYTRTSA